MKNKIIFTLTLALLLFTSAKTHADNYINWGKGYYITIPEDWRQIERFNVDNFLRLHGKDTDAMEYDAFFCPKDAEPFYRKAYVFVHAELMENSIAVADSMRLVLASEFDEMANALTDSSAVTRVKSGKPLYSSKGRHITMISNLQAGDQDQIMMLVIKFYKKGIATFYCYTTREWFKTYKPVFESIRDGFGDDDLNAAAKKEPVKIATIENNSGATVDQPNSSPSSSETESSETSSFPIWVPFVGVGIVALGIFILRKKSRT